MMTTAIKIVAVAGVVLLGLVVSPALAQRQMESLGRGVVAIPKDGGKVFVGWRLLGTDPDDIAFNVYRSSGSAPHREIERRAAPGRDEFRRQRRSFAGRHLLFRPAGARRPGRGGQRTVPPSSGRSDDALYLHPTSDPSRATHRTTPRSATSTATASTRSS